jgi:predicted transcriptional regulator
MGLEMVRRDRHDIVMSILNNAKSSRSKTEIISSVNMSSAQARQYLGLLMEKGLLESSENRIFKTTKKGLDYMEKCGECFLCHWHPETRKSR